MNLAETNDLLEIINDFVPSYEVTKGRVKKWNKILGNMSYPEAEKYMYQHFQETKYMPMPVDILNRARSDFNPDKLVPLDPPDDMRGEATLNDRRP
jgi:hypothetical protein